MRKIAIVLVLILVISAFSGCAQKSTNNPMLYYSSKENLGTTE